MSMHVSDLKGGFLGLLAELGFVDPFVEREQDRVSGDAIPPSDLSDEQKLLLVAYNSGQIEPWAWEEHLSVDPVLMRHVSGQNQG